MTPPLQTAHRSRWLTTPSRRRHLRPILRATASTKTKVCPTTTTIGATSERGLWTTAQESYTTWTTCRICRTNHLTLSPLSARCRPPTTCPTHLSHWATGSVTSTTQRLQARITRRRHTHRRTRKRERLRSLRVSASTSTRSRATSSSTGSGT